MSVTSASARTFRSLQRHRNYRLFFAGQSISISGTWVQNIAQAWMIVELTPVSYTHLDVYKRQALSDVTHPHVGIASEADEDVAVVGQQRPLAWHDRGLVR